jgi:hypothetical protein
MKNIFLGLFNRNSSKPEISKAEAQVLLLQAVWEGNIMDTASALVYGADPNAADIKGDTAMGQFVKGYTKFRLWDATGPETLRIKKRDGEYLNVALMLIEKGVNLQPHGQEIRRMPATQVRQYLATQFDVQMRCIPPSKPASP